MGMYRMDAGAREPLAVVFSDKVLKKIWFELGQVRIDGGELDIVGYLIRKDKIQCWGAVSQDILKSREAMYNVEHNTLLLSDRLASRGLNVVEESVILHEGVHAYLDYKKCRDMTYFHNEALAYVTQSLFLRHKGVGWPSHLQHDSVVKAVEALVDRFKMTEGKKSLPWTLFEPLMRAIQAHPTYVMKTAEGDVQMPWDTKVTLDGIAALPATGGLQSKSAVAARSREPVGMEVSAQTCARSRRGPLGYA